MRYIIAIFFAIIATPAFAQVPSNDLIVKEKVEYHGTRWPFNGFDSRIVRQYVLDQLSMERVNAHWDIFPEEEFKSILGLLGTKEEREDLNQLRKNGYFLSFKLRWAAESGTQRESWSASQGYYYPSRDIFGRPTRRRQVTSSSSSSTTDKLIGGSAYLTYTVWNREVGSTSRTVRVEGHEVVRTSSKYSSSFDGFSYSRSTSRSSNWAEAELEHRLAFALAYELIRSLKAVWAELPHHNDEARAEALAAPCSPSLPVAAGNEVWTRLTPHEARKARQARAILVVWRDDDGRERKLTVTDFDVRTSHEGGEVLILRPPAPMPAQVEIHWR